MQPNRSTNTDLSLGDDWGLSPTGATPAMNTWDAANVTAIANANATANATATAQLFFIDVSGQSASQQTKFFKNAFPAATECQISQDDRTNLTDNLSFIVDFGLRYSSYFLGHCMSPSLKLSHLQIAYCYIDDRVVIQISKSFPNLVFLGIPGSFMTDMGLKALSQAYFPALESLDVSGSELVTVKGYKALAKATWPRLSFIDTGALGVEATKFLFAGDLVCRTMYFHEAYEGRLTRNN